VSSKRYSAEGPLTARSVLASALLGTEPPVLPVARLVALASLFGVNEGSARVALSRMAAAGEVTAENGAYRLAGHLLDRQARQRVSRTPRLRAWRGEWTMVAVTAGRRAAADRSAFRAALGRARLAELREGLWLRPANLDVDVAPDVEAVTTRFTGRPDGDAAALAATLWDLSGWATRAGELREELGVLAPALDAGDTAALAPGFVVSAAVLRHLQADPLLPSELLPRQWPGQPLRTEYDRWDAAYRRTLAAWHHAQTPV